MNKRNLKRIFAAFIAAAAATTMVFAAACSDGGNNEGNGETPGITDPDDGNNNDGNNGGNNDPDGGNDGGNEDGNIPGGGDGPAESADIFWNKTAAFATGDSDADGGIAEIVQYNAENDKIYLVNGKTGALDIVSMSLYGNTDELATKFDESSDRIDIRQMIADNANKFPAGFEYGDLTSIALNSELDRIALAVQHADYSKNGAIVIADYNGKFVAAYEAGVQPDMVTFAGNIALSANEGEPREGYGTGAIDPTGSVTAVDISAANPAAKTITFEKFDAQRAALVEDGVILKKGAAPSVDLEPEYIAASGTKAYVALQEANAIATLDLESLEFTAVNGLGFKDHSVQGNGLDMRKDDKAEVKTENVYGVYMPDGLATFTAGGKTYLVTANEGDAREWGDGDNAYENVDKFTIDGEEKVEALINEEHDGLEEGKHYLLGARSFSVWDTEDMSLAFDSGDMIESYIAASEDYSAYFNCSNDDVELDSRSRKKGPEPEAVNVQTIDGKTYAFVALERQGGVMMFDITDLENVEIVSYANSRDYTADMAGDVAPESVAFVPAADALNEKNMLVVANENSGTIAIYSMESEAKTYEMHQTFIKAPEEAVTPADHLIIWSVYGTGGKDEAVVTNEFISIKNPTSSAVDLTGWKVRYSTLRDGGERVWKDIALEGTLEAGGTYVIIGAETDNASTYFGFAEGEYDLKMDDLVIDNKQFSLQLTDGEGKVVDALGVIEKDNNELGEGTLVADINKHSVVVRVNDGDSDNNAADFAVVDLEDIQNPADYKPLNK